MNIFIYSICGQAIFDMDSQSAYLIAESTNTYVIASFGDIQVVANQYKGCNTIRKPVAALAFQQFVKKSNYNMEQYLVDSTFMEGFFKTYSAA